MMDVAVASHPSDLVQLVEHARALLDSGDVERALTLSAVAYDQAKAAAGSAERVKASRELVEKARRMQADALKIESACYVAMADAVDDAQKSGEVSRGGRPKNVPEENGFTLDEIGVDRKQLHTARQLRNAVRAEPDFVERVVEARLAEGLEPSRAALKKAAGHAIGTKSATKEERGDDLYETPIEAMRTLLALESFSATVREPSVGRGAILRPLEAAGYDVEISDLVDREIVTAAGICQEVGDFLLTSIDDEYASGPDIVTNPPYGIANAYIAHALRAHRPRKMAMLLNLNFMAGVEDDDRCFVLDECPPSRVYVFTRRLPMMHRDGWDGPKASSQMNTAWFVWERNADGSYGSVFGSWRTIRVDWKNFTDADRIEPGAGLFLPPITRHEPEPDEEDFTRTTPRTTPEERVDAERPRALLWMAEQESFDDETLRKGIGRRRSTALGLIDAFSSEGLIAPYTQEDGRVVWKVTDAGWLALRAAAGALVGLTALAALDELSGVAAE